MYTTKYSMIWTKAHVCRQQLCVTGFGQYAKYWPRLELWAGEGNHGGRQCVISSPACHTTQSANASPASNQLYYTVPPPIQRSLLCSLGALIPMPPTQLMPPASTNCPVCHFRGFVPGIQNLEPYRTNLRWLVWLQSWCHINVDVAVSNIFRREPWTLDRAVIIDSQSLGDTQVGYTLYQTASAQYTSI